MSVAHAVEVADAQLVVLGAGAQDDADQAVPVGVRVGAPEHHRRRARAERQRRELREHVLARSRRAAESRVDGVLLDLPRPLAVDDERVLDLARVDHHGGELHAVDEAQAGVGDVEVQAGARQAERVVHGDRPRTARGARG